MFKRVRKRLVAGVVAAVALTSGAVVATAPDAAAAGTTEYVYSAAMGRNVPVRIISGGGGAAKPTLYLLDGLRAPANNSGWLINTNVDSFMVGKGVNVAIPLIRADLHASPAQMHQLPALSARHEIPLEQANQALAAIRSGASEGSTVLKL